MCILWSGDVRLNEPKKRHKTLPEVLPSSKSLVCRVENEALWLADPLRSLWLWSCWMDSSKLSLSYKEKPILPIRKCFKHHTCTMWLITLTTQKQGKSHIASHDQTEHANKHHRCTLWLITLTVVMASTLLSVCSRYCPNIWSTLCRLRLVSCSF